MMKFCFFKYYRSCVGWKFYYKIDKLLLLLHRTFVVYVFLTHVRIHGLEIKTKELPKEIMKLERTEPKLKMFYSERRKLLTSGSYESSLLPKLKPRPRNKTTKFPGYSGNSVGGESREILNFYCHFIGDFSESMKWQEFQGLVKLQFPTSTVDINICALFQTVLLKNYDLITWCISSSFFVTDTNITQDFNLKWKNSVEKYERSPIILLDFIGRRNRTMKDYFNFNKYLINYKTSQQILILNDDTEKEIILEEIQPEKNSNFKLILATRKVDSIKTNLLLDIDEVYGFATSSMPITNLIGTWSLSSRLKLNERRHGLDNFQGRHLRVTSVEGQPVVFLDKDFETGELKGRGYLPDILNAISSHLNFSYSLIRPIDNSFGTANSTGHWNGMVGLLVRKEAEMALMSFSLTSARKTVMDFSPPIEYSSTGLLIRRDFQISELKWNAFLEPFHWSVWVAIPVIIIIGVLCLLIFIQCKILDTTPGSTAWLLSCCILQQGLDEHSVFEKLPSRIALGSFWILAVVLYASYCATLTAHLAASSDSLPFQNLAEAVQSKWKLGVVKGSSYQDRVKESSLPEMKKFSHDLEKDTSRLVSGFREGVDRVFTEKYIFFTSDLVPTFMIKGNCSYAWIPQRFFPGFGYMGYQKELAYAASISNRVSKIRESGQMKRFFQKWWGSGEGSCTKSGDSFVPMTLYETGTYFIILIVGISCSFLGLSLEVVFKPKVKTLPPPPPTSSGSQSPSLFTYNNTTREPTSGYSADLRIANLGFIKSLWPFTSLGSTTSKERMNISNTLY